MRTHPLTRLAALSAALLLATAGCGKDSPTSPKSTSFSANVTGALTRSLSGEAYGEAFPDDAGGPDDYVIALTNGPIASTDAVVFLEHFGDVVKRQYSVVGVNDAPTATNFLASFFTDAGDEYYSTGGTVTIESVSSARVSGRFDVQMTTDDAGRSTQLTLHITGTFDGPNDGIPLNAVSSRAHVTRLVPGAAHAWRAAATGSARALAH